MAHPALQLLFGPSTADEDDWSRRSPSECPSRDDGDRIHGDDHAETRHLERIQLGDRRVLAELYDTYFADLWAFAFRYVRDQAAAEDIVHDVFLKLWSARVTIDVRTSLGTTLRAYLFSVVANRARNVAAQSRRDEALMSSLTTHETQQSDDAADPPASPYEQAESANVRQVLMTAVSALPERQQMALTLRLVNDLTYDEIATILGVTKSAVAKLISKAQTHLKLALGRDLP